MKKTITLPLLLLLLLTLPLHAETRIRGTISHIDFSPDGNPFIIENEITIPEGKAISIPAGCILLFEPFTGIIVNGTITVNGSAEQPVVFTSVYDREYNPDSPQPANLFDWNGILINTSSKNNVLTNFRLTFSVYGIKSLSEEGIRIVNGMFADNGQFHFTIKEKLQYVQDNIPFSYTPESDEETVEPVAANPQPEKEPPTGWLSGKNIVSLSLLGIGAIAGTVGIYNGVAASESSTKAEEALTENEFERYTDDFEAERFRSVAGITGACISLPASAVVYYLFGKKPDTMQTAALTLFLPTRGVTGVVMNMHF